MRTMLTEARHALRLLRKSPGFTLVAVLTLAIGIGVNVAIFSVVQGVLLRPLPFAAPERLVFLWEGTPQFPDMSVSFPDFDDWRKTQHTFVDIAAARGQAYTMTGVGAAERAQARMVSANFLRVLGVRPALGRDFLDAEEQPNAPPVALVSDKFWRERLGGDAGALGRTLTLDGRAFSIVGILPAGFQYYGESPIYVTLAQLDPLDRATRGAHPGMYGIGRLKDGVGIDQARADMTTLGRAIQVASGNMKSQVLPKLWPLQSKHVEDVQTTLWLLLGAVAFVLLIASANVANLMLARGTARSRELAVRAALGADRWALMRPLLVESGLIALIGGALGVVMALWGVDLLVALKPESIPRGSIIKIDRVVLAYSLALTSVTALLCGLVPAIRASRADVHDALKAAGSRGVAGVAHGRLRATLVVAEVALALVLLVGAGLSLRTFQHLSSLDVGFRSEDTFVAALSFSPARYDTPDKVRNVLAEVQRHLASAPGVLNATVAGGLPFNGAPEQSFQIHGDPQQEHMAVQYMVGAGYLDTLGIKLLAGRDLGAGDGPKSAPVVLVDETLATKFFGSPSGALGQSISFYTTKQAEIVGVVRHVMHYGLEGRVPAQYEFYSPLAQVPDPILPLVHEVNIAMRGPHAATLGAVARTALAAYDSEMPLADETTMEQAIADSIGGRKFAMLLLAVFAVVALILAVVGLYAVMSYMVTQRNHEIGVRMALGANPGDVQRMVVRQGLVLVAIGLGLGLGASLALGKVMATLVNGVGPSDAVTFAAVSLLLTIAATAASLLPARAATRVDPMVVLRYE
ncbi:MAG TPA: ABC transporter permease [Polyangia bacterium]|jgi:predicted permease